MNRKGKGMRGLNAADLIRAGGKLPAELLAQAEKRAKYGNRKPVIDSIEFDSQREADEYCRLKLLKRAGMIVGFEMQVDFIIEPGFRRGRRTYRPEKYRADFVVTNLDGSKTIREVKGVRTPLYMSKRKRFMARYPEYGFEEC
jgi:hypothetical protein